MHDLPKRLEQSEAYWLIIGGTGFVGRALAEVLSRPAHQARRPRLLVPTRHRAHAQRLSHLPTVDVVQADVHDDGDLQRLVAGASAIVNLVGVLHGDEAAFDRAHAALPRRLAQACQAAGVRRVVHVSAIGASAEAPSKYLRSKARGEAFLRAADLDLTILRPSVVFGAQDQFLNLFARLQRVLPLMALAGGEARFAPVWVGDLAEAIARCLEQPATIGQTYECVGPEVLTLAQLVQAAGRYAGHARPIVPLPMWMGRLQAALFECLPGEPLMSRDNLDSMQVPNIATPGQPGLPALGIQPATLDSVAPGYLSPRHGTSRLEALRARHPT
ncbi:complex I NDUFA9 subunit family protein [Ideonella sp. DXS29W]|uniref:Complex I NDUFA9 subunit family protein n=1 Tax=Ideonella lacteola TaxID=2984193 RepID=A0ABU9BR48_9BURK